MERRSGRDERHRYCLDRVLTLWVSGTSDRRSRAAHSGLQGLLSIQYHTGRAFVTVPIQLALDLTSSLFDATVVNSGVHFTDKGRLDRIARPEACGLQLDGLLFSVRHRHTEEPRTCQFSIFCFPVRDLQGDRLIESVRICYSGSARAPGPLALDGCIVPDCGVAGWKACEKKNNNGKESHGCKVEKAAACQIRWTPDYAFELTSWNLGSTRRGLPSVQSGDNKVRTQLRKRRSKKIVPRKIKPRMSTIQNHV